MRIYIDGDACPVKAEAYRVAARYAVPIVVVANAPLRVPADSGVTLVQVPGGPDEVDDWIAAAVESGDIVATADLPLAARAIDREAAALDFRGGEFTANAIGNLLASREIAQQLRASASYAGGPKPLTPRDRGRFAAKLDEVINRLRRQGAAAG